MGICSDKAKIIEADFIKEVRKDPLYNYVEDIRGRVWRGKGSFEFILDVYVSKKTPLDLITKFSKSYLYLSEEYPDLQGVYKVRLL